MSPEVHKTKARLSQEWDRLTLQMLTLKYSLVYFKSQNKFGVSVSQSKI